MKALSAARYTTLSHPSAPRCSTGCPRRRQTRPPPGVANAVMVRPRASSAIKSSAVQVGDASPHRRATHLRESQVVCSGVTGRARRRGCGVSGLVELAHLPAARLVGGKTRVLARDRPEGARGFAEPCRARASADTRVRACLGGPVGRGCRSEGLKRAGERADLQPVCCDGGRLGCWAAQPAAMLPTSSLGARPSASGSGSGISAIDSAER